MENIKKIKIKRSSAQVGMQVAEEIFADNKTSFLAQDIVLTPKIIEQLSIHNIETIVIYKSDKFEVEELPEDEIKETVTTEKPINKGSQSVDKKSSDFLSFKQTFLKNAENVETYLNSIYKKEKIDKKEAYELVTGVFNDISYRQDLFLYLSALESTASYLYEHSVRVGLIANVFASWLGLSEEACIDLTIAGLLHDVGMTQVPKALLEKKERLTEEEFQVVKGHTSAGSLMIMSKDIKKEIRDAVLMHHERIDGSGYPNGRRGNTIPLYAKIIGIVDVYDAMSADRLYRDAHCPFDIIKFLEEDMINQLDPELLYTFLQNIPYMYKGSTIQLSNGEVGKVMFINRNYKTHPIVLMQHNNELLDLAVRTDLKITTIL